MIFAFKRVDNMNRMRKIFEHVRADEVTRKKLISITVSFVLVLAILMIRSDDANNKYIVDKKDNVVGIHRNDISQASTFDFKIRAESEDETVEKELTISPQIVRDKGKKESGRLSSSTEDEINHVVSAIESTKDKNIMLPNKLPNGSRLTWERARKSNGDHLLVFALYAVLVGLIIKESLREESGEEEERNDIVLKLPRFTNQLMLIMNAGMIQNDAVNQICGGYDMVSEEDLGFFEKSLISISKNEKKQNLGMSAAFTDFACEIGRASCRERV